MVVCDGLRTIDLARAGQLSVQQVRNYEAQGLLPPAERGPHGYRRYTHKHLVALNVARGLAGGYGWQRARAIMRGINRGDVPGALALIDERHAELAHQRLQLEQTLTALRVLATQSAVLTNTRRTEPRRVGEAAREVGVRVSALHFWEQQGLLHPARDMTSRYRFYNEQQMRHLRVVVLLRAAGYTFAAIRTTLDELAAGVPEQAIAAGEMRRAELAKASYTCLSAMAALQHYLGAFWPEQCAAL